MVTTATTTGLLQEVLLSDGSSARIDSVVFEALIQDPATVRVDSVLFEALVKDPATTRVDGLVVEILHNNIVAGSLTETGSAVDTPSAIAFYGVLDAETGSASDTPSASARYPVSLSEAASASDTVTGTVTHRVSLHEIASGTDTLVADATYVSILDETGSATTNLTVTGSFEASLTETVSATATPSIPFSDWSVSLDERANAQDSLPDVASGGGGGGAGGPNGRGQAGTSGTPSTPGAGGDGDGHTVPGATSASQNGNSGTEFSPSYGVGSGGAGALGGTTPGTLYNENGTISIWYKSSVTLEVVGLLLTTSSTSPFVVPSDWSNENFIGLTGAGCHTIGQVVQLVNVTTYVAGDTIPFFVAPFCSSSPTIFDTTTAASGQVGSTAIVGIGGNGGQYGGGGGGGTGGAGGKGGDGLIYITYVSTADSTTKTIVLNVSDNPEFCYTLPADWSDDNEIRLLGSGGNGATGTAFFGGNGGGGGAYEDATGVSGFSPGECVPFFVSPGGSGIPTRFGSFKADTGTNGDETSPPSISVFNELTGFGSGTSSRTSWPSSTGGIGFGTGGPGGAVHFTTELHEPAAAVDLILLELIRHSSASLQPTIVYATDVWLRWMGETDFIIDVETQAAFADVQITQPQNALGYTDFRIELADLASHRDLVTAITLSLFTNRRAFDDQELPDPNSIDRGGWWGDVFLIDAVGQPLGSRLWLLRRSKSSPVLPIIAKGYVEEALWWVTEKNVAASMTVDTFFIAADPSKLGIVITLDRGEGDIVNLTYQWAWDQLTVIPPKLGGLDR